MKISDLTINELNDYFTLSLKIAEMTANRIRACNAEDNRLNMEFRKNNDIMDMLQAEIKKRLNELE